MEQFGERTLRLDSPSSVRSHRKSRGDPGGVPLRQSDQCVPLSCGVHFQEQGMFTGGNVFAMHPNFQTKAVSKIVQLQIHKQPMCESLTTNATTSIAGDTDK